MEKYESFQSLSAKIKSYERELVLCDQVGRECEKSAQSAEKEIEEHFALLLNSLALRKAALLNDISVRVAGHKKCVEAAKNQLQSSISASKKALEAGMHAAAVSEAAAEIVWKSLSNMPAIHAPKVHITTVLPTQLRDAIQRHGSVGEVGNSKSLEAVPNPITVAAPSIADNPPVPIPVPVPPPQAAPQPIIYYDIQGTRVDGVLDHLAESFPRAIKYEKNQVDQASVIISFVPTTFYDLKQWERICEERALTGAKHFVVHCSIFGKSMFPPLKCTAQYEVDVGGSIVAPRVKRASLEAVFEKIKSQF